MAVLENIKENVFVWLVFSLLILHFVSYLNSYVFMF